MNLENYNSDPPKTPDEWRRFWKMEDEWRKLFPTLVAFDTMVRAAVLTRKVLPYAIVIVMVSLISYNLPAILTVLRGGAP